MAWTDYLADRSGSYAFLAHIEGAPRVFANRIPLAADGTAFPAPVDQYGNAFAVSEVLLSAGGFGVSGGEWKRESAVLGGGDFTIKLLADATVRALFATRKSGVASSRLTVDCDHDDVSLTVADATVLPAPGAGWATAYRGRETFQYDQVVGNVLGGAGHIRRGCYGWQSDSVLARRHRVNDGVATRAIYVTDWPLSWEGRRVTLVRVQLDERGYAVGATTWQGGVEVATGFIRPDCGYDGDWGAYTIRCNDITYALKEYELGRKRLSGMVAASPDDAGVYIDSTGCYFGLRFSVGATDEQTGNYYITEDGTDGGTKVTGYRSAQRLAQLFALRLKTIINTATGADNVSIAANWIVGPNDAGDAVVASVQLSWCNASVAASGWARIHLLPDHGIGWLLPSFLITDFPMAWDSAAGANGGMDRATIFANIALGTTIPAAADNIPAKKVADEAGVPATPPTSGYVRISNGVATEVVSYAGTTAMTNPPASYLLTGCVRGLFGTTPQSWATGWDGHGVYLGDEITIEFLDGWGDESAALEGTDCGTIALDVLLSTGTAGAYHATYDALSYGLALDPACIDVNGIAAALRPYRRKGLIEDGVTFAELLKDVCLLSGVAFLVETGSDGRRRLTCREFGDPLAAQSGTAPAFSAANGTILLEPKPELRHSYQKVIDRVTAKLTRYSPVESTTEEFVVVDGTREEDQGPGRTVDVSAWGFVGDGRDAMIAAAPKLFNLYAPDEYEVEFSTNATGQKVRPGDVITVTIAGIPNPEGTLGLTDRPCIVRSVEPGWFEDGSRPGAKIVALVRALVRGWAPSFKISVYDVGPPVTVTLADNEFSLPGDVNPTGATPTKDHHFGPTTGKPFSVYIYEDGDEANRTQRVATYSSAGVWTLDSALPGGWGAAPYYAVFASYDDADRDSAQGDYAHVADATKTLGAAADDPHTWTA